MIYKATKKVVDNYFNTNSISQSHIKLFMKGFDYYLKYKNQVKSDKYFDEPADHYIIGNGVDTLLTYEPEEMEKIFYVGVSSEKPSALEISMLKYIFDQIKTRGSVDGLDSNVLLDNKKYMLESLAYHNYQPKWNETSRLKVFETDTIGRYWLDLTLSKERQILTLEEKTMITTLTDNFRNSHYTRHLFVNESDSDVDIFYQVPIYTKIDNIQVKGLIDIVYVNYSSKEITLYDIKTMSDGVLLFPNNYRKFGYDFQASFYYHLLEINNLSYHVNVTNEKAQIITKSKLLDFKFAVVSKSFPSSSAIIYSTGDKIQDAIMGKTESYFNSVSNDGRFHEHKYRSVTSISQYVNLLNQSIIAGHDVRIDQGLNLSNL